MKFQTELDKQKFIGKLTAVANKYQQSSATKPDGLEKNIEEDLAKTLKFIADNYYEIESTDTIGFEDGTKNARDEISVDMQTLSGMILGFVMTQADWEEKNQEEKKEILKRFHKVAHNISVLDLESGNRFLDLPNEFVGYFVKGEYIAWTFSRLASTRCSEENPIEKSLDFKDISIPFMTQPLWDKLESLKDEKISDSLSQDMITIYDRQKVQNDSLISCNYIRYAMTFPSLFENQAMTNCVFKSWDFISKKIKDMERLHSAESTQGYLKPQLAEAIARCKEMDKDLKEAFFSKMSELEPHKDLITRKIMWKLAKEKKFADLSQINIDSFFEGIQDDNQGKILLKGIVDDIKKMAEKRSNAGVLESFALNIYDLLMWIIDIAREHLLMKTNDKNQINSSCSWVEFKARASLRETAVQQPN